MAHDIGLPAYLTSAEVPRTAGWSETISIDGIIAIECIRRTTRDVAGIEAHHVFVRSWEVGWLAVGALVPAAG